MGRDLWTELEHVCDEISFIKFLEVLAADRKDAAIREKSGLPPSDGTGTSDWQNGTIENFLECAAAWASSSIDGLAVYQKPDNPWKRCADIIYMGKIYE